MKNIYSTLTQLKTDLQNDIPALLSTQSLPALSQFQLGGSRDVNIKGCFLYKDELQRTASQNSLSLFVQLQLAGVGFIDACKIEDIFADYFSSYNPGKVGAVSLEFTSDTFPIEQTAGTFVFFRLLFLEDKDSCD